MKKSKDLFNEMDSLMDLSLSRTSYVNVSGDYFSPPTDIYENESEIVIFIEISGMKKKDIDLTFHDGILVVSGERKHMCNPCIKTIHRMEINTGRFLRRISFSIDIDPDGIEAEYRDGILKVLLPKKG